MTRNELDAVNEVFCFSEYGVDKKNRYLRNVQSFFDEQSHLAVSSIISEEYAKILDNSRSLLKNDCALGLKKLSGYLRCQKTILDVVHIKTKNIDDSFLKLSTFVAKVALFDIDQAFLIRKPLSPYHPDMNEYATDLELNSWHAFNILDKFCLLDDYKTKIYIPKREQIRRECIRKKIDVNSVKADISKTSPSGCLSFIFIFILLSLLSTI